MARDDKAKAPPAGSGRKEEPAAAPAKKKGKTGLIVAIAVVSVLVIAGGGGAAWWFLRGEPPAKDAAGQEAPAPKAEKAKPALFVPLETFTVNLQAEGGERYLQTTLSLRVADVAVEQSVKQLMPEIRSRVLLLLSSKKPAELSTVEGKQVLANQIAAEVNGVLAPGTPRPAGAKPAPEAAKAAPETAKPAPDAAPEAKAAPDGPGAAKPVEAAPAAAKAPPAAPASPGPVLSVLFTNFIIQ